MSKVLTCNEVWGGGAAIDTDFTMPGVEGALFSHPADGKNGGDIYLVSTCNVGQVCKVVLADVAGHGEQVAHVGQLLGDLLRDNSAERDNARFLDQLNQQFEAADGHGVVFATLACGTYFAHTQEFCFAYAGHPHILLGRAGRFEPLGVAINPDGRRNANVPIGITREANFHEGCLKLQPGDWLIFFTDGVVEARNELGQQYGLARLVSDLERLAASSPMVLKNGLLTRLRDFIAPRRLDQDDVTLIVLTLREIPKPPIVRMAPELARLMGQSPPKP